MRREFVEHARRLAGLLPGVHRQLYDAPLVRDRQPYGLPDPPGGVGRKAVAPFRVEPLDGFDQADVALLDQVLEGEPHPPVPLGHRDHQSEVALYQLSARSLVSGASPPGEGYLLWVGQEPAPSDLLQVACEELRGFQLLPPLSGADLIE